MRLEKLWRPIPVQFGPVHDVAQDFAIRVAAKERLLVLLGLLRCLAAWAAEGGWDCAQKGAMDGCGNVCAATTPSATTEIKLEHMPYTQEEMELLKEFETLALSVSRPQEMLSSLKLQHTALQSTMVDMEDMLSTSQMQLAQLAAKVEKVQKMHREREKTVESLGIGEEVRETTESVDETNITADAPQVMATTSDVVQAILQRSDSQQEANNKTGKTHYLLEKVRQSHKPTLTFKALPPIEKGFWPFLTALCKRVTMSYYFECIISLVIVANSAMLGVESQMSMENKNLDWASQAEACFIFVYTIECILRAIAERKSPGLLLYCAILDVVSSTVCLCIFLHISDPVEFSPAPAPAPTHAAPSPTAVAQAQRQNQRQRALDPPRMQHQPNVNANARQRHSPREHTAPAPAPAPAPAHGISLSPTPRSANDHPRALEFQKSWVDSETYAQVLEGIKDGVAEGYYASYSGPSLFRVRKIDDKDKLKMALIAPADAAGGLVAGVFAGLVAAGAYGTAGGIIAGSATAETIGLGFVSLMAGLVSGAVTGAVDRVPFRRSGASTVRGDQKRQHHRTLTKCARVGFEMAEDGKFLPDESCVLLSRFFQGPNKGEQEWRWGVLRDGWFIFDVILVISAYVEQIYALVYDVSDQQVMVLRAMRLIRLVRTFRDQEAAGDLQTVDFMIASVRSIAVVLAYGEG
ncbi:CACNA1H, partial [Symbiodinium microadriaticum]